MKFDRLEDIMAWQKAKDLVLRIYKEFGSLKDFAFRDQIRRASISVMNNIAEGYERGSNPDFKRFLFMAKGSSGEVRSMSYVALELNYINNTEFNEINSLSTEISRMISGLIKKL